MDVIKVRLQVQSQLMAEKASTVLYRGTVDCAKRIVVEEGFFSLWKYGLAASLLRDMSYSSIRLGLYPTFRHLFQPKEGIVDSKGHVQDAGLARKVAASLLTGAMGSAIATPTDRVKIMLQGEAGRIGSSGVYETGLWKGRPPSFSNTAAAFIGLYREGGLRGMYKGTGITAVRAALLTAGQLASYDHTKFLLKEHEILEEGFALHMIGSLVAGLCATTLAAPADVIKTRLMNDRDAVSHGQTRNYSGAVDCFLKVRGWMVGDRAVVHRVGRTGRCSIALVGHSLPRFRLSAKADPARC